MEIGYLESKEEDRRGEQYGDIEIDDHLCQIVSQMHSHGCPTTIWHQFDIGFYSTSYSRSPFTYLDAL
jgi:hypothetical protein